jgi:hypothetical protein
MNSDPHIHEIIKAIAKYEADRLSLDYNDQYETMMECPCWLVPQYSTDSPGYVGRVFVVLWPASPGALSSYIENATGWVHCNSTSW